MNNIDKAIPQTPTPTLPYPTLPYPARTKVLYTGATEKEEEEEEAKGKGIYSLSLRH